MCFALFLKLSTDIFHNVYQFFFQNKMPNTPKTFSYLMCGWAYSRWAFGRLLIDGRGPKSPLSKICQTYLAIIKLGTVIPSLMNIRKIYESRDTLLDFCWCNQFFHRKQAMFVIWGNTDVNCILTHNYWFF